jgi:segregation and condensation protein B
MRESDRAGAVEAILFVATAPVTVQSVVEAFEGRLTAQEALAVLEGLQERYERESQGLRLERVAEGFRIVTRPAHGHFVRNFLKAQNLRKLTPAAVETLAIVAYKQPITTAEASAVRGTESGTVLKGLLEKKLIRIAGRKNVVGRPLLYATTKEFLMHFGLNSLDDLPSFRELEEVFRETVRQESLFKEAAPAPAEGEGEAEAEPPAEAAPAPEEAAPPAPAEEAEPNPPGPVEPAGQEVDPVP